VLLEHYHKIDAETLLHENGIHPFYSKQNQIYCSGGSLGQGLTVAVGYALANPNKTVYVTISDGECSEGCVWEALRFINEKNIANIKVFVNMNGVSAINYVDIGYLSKCLYTFYPNINIRNTTVETFNFLKGLEAHYKVMSPEDYQLALQQLI
jgi:deoxyxylulose-5-phosphate synthase